MIIWDTLKVQNASNTLTITPGQLTTTASNGFTISGAATVSGTFTCNKIQDSGTATSTLYNLTLSNRLKIRDSNAISTRSATNESGITFSNALTYDRLTFYDNILRSQWTGNDGWYICADFGVTTVWPGGGSKFFRIRNRDEGDADGLGFKYSSSVESSGTLDITNWDASAYRNLHVSYLKAENQITATTFNSTSDRRLKTNIQPWQPKHSILDLPVYSFDYISDNSHHIGCLAQDLQSICPELVNEGTDGYLHIEESKLIYLLMQEVRELKQQVLALSQK